MARTRRDVAEYLASAGELSAILPQFSKLKKRKTLKSWEKAWIARTENIYKFTRDLRPVSKQDAREFPELLYRPETTIKSGPRAGQIRHHAPVQAMQQANAGSDFKVLGRISKNLHVIRSNGRTWVHWRLTSIEPHDIEEAGEEAFDDPYTYEIEEVIKLAEQAFQNPETKAVYLLSDKGRVGAPMPSLKQFIRWVADDYSRYENTDRWVHGIAILIGDVGEHVTDEQFNTFSPRRVPKERVYKPKRKRRRKRK